MTDIKAIHLIPKTKVSPNQALSDSLILCMMSFDYVLIKINEMEISLKKFGKSMDKQEKIDILEQNIRAKLKGSNNYNIKIMLKK